MMVSFVSLKKACVHLGRGLGLGSMLAVLGLFLGSAMLSCGALSDEGPKRYGPQGAVIILAYYEDAQPYLDSVAQVQERLEGAAAYLQRQSEGQLWLESPFGAGAPGAVLGPIRLESPPPDCDDLSFVTDLAQSALSHPEIKERLASHSREVDRVLVMLGGQSCKEKAGQGGVPRRLVAGGAVYDASLGYLSPAIGWSGIAHELLHGLGMGHDLGLDCAEAKGDISACTPLESGNPLSLMGSRFGGHGTAPMLDRLGWLSCATIDKNVQDMRLDALELKATSAERCLRIPVSDGFLYVEHRAWEGYDALGYIHFDFQPTTFQGVLIYHRPRVEDADTYAPSYLLSMADFDPGLGCEGEDWAECQRFRAPLLEGRTYTHLDGTTITLEEHRPYSSFISVGGID